MNHQRRNLCETKKKNSRYDRLYKTIDYDKQKSVNQSFNQPKLNSNVTVKKICLWDAYNQQQQLQRNSTKDKSMISFLKLHGDVLDKDISWNRIFISLINNFKKVFSRLNRQYHQIINHFIQQNFSSFLMIIVIQKLKNLKNEIKMIKLKIQKYLLNYENLNLRSLKQKYRLLQKKCFQVQKILNIILQYSQMFLKKIISEENPQNFKNKESIITEMMKQIKFSMQFYPKDSIKYIIVTKVQQIIRFIVQYHNQCVQNLIILSKNYWNIIFDKKQISAYFETQKINLQLQKQLENHVEETFKQFSTQVRESRQYKNVLEQIDQILSLNLVELKKLLKKTKRNCDMFQHADIIFLNMHQSQKGLSVLKYLEKYFDKYLLELDFNSYLDKCYTKKIESVESMTFITYKIKQGCQLPNTESYKLIEQISAIIDRFNVLQDGVNLWQLTGQMWQQCLNNSSENVTFDMKVLLQLQEKLQLTNRQNQVSHFIKPIHQKCNICIKAVTQHKQQFSSIIKSFNQNKNSILQKIVHLKNIYQQSIEEFTVTNNDDLLTIMLIDKSHLTQQQNENLISKLILDSNSNNRNYTKHQLIEAINSLKFNDQNSIDICLKLLQMMHILFTYIRNPILIIKPTLNELMLAIIAYFTNINYNTQEAQLQQLQKNLQIKQQTEIKTRITIPSQIAIPFRSEIYYEILKLFAIQRQQLRQNFIQGKFNYCYLAWHVDKNDITRQILQKWKKQLFVWKQKIFQELNGSICHYISKLSKQVNIFISSIQQQYLLLCQILEFNQKLTQIQHIKQASSKVKLIKKWIIQYLEIQDIVSYLIKQQKSNSGWISKKEIEIEIEIDLICCDIRNREPAKNISNIIGIMMNKNGQDIYKTFSKYFIPFCQLQENQVSIDYLKIIEELKNNVKQNLVSKQCIEELMNNFNLCHFKKLDSSILLPLVSTILQGMQVEESIFCFLRDLKDRQSYLLQASVKLRDLFEFLGLYISTANSEQELLQRKKQLEQINFSCISAQQQQQQENYHQNISQFNKWIKKASVQYRIPLYQIFSEKDDLICNFPASDQQEIKKKLRQFDLPMIQEEWPIEKLITPLKLLPAKVTYYLGGDLRSQTLQWMIEENFGLDIANGYSLRMAIYQIYHHRQDLLYFGLPKFWQQLSLNLNELVISPTLIFVLLKYDTSQTEAQQFKWSDDIQQRQSTIIKGVHAGSECILKQIGQNLLSMKEKILKKKMQDDIQQYIYFIKQIEQAINNELKTQIMTTIEQIKQYLLKKQDTNNNVYNLSHESQNKINNIQNIINKLYISMNIDQKNKPRSLQIKKYYLNKIRIRYFEKEKINKQIIQKATKNYQNQVFINSSMQNESYTTYTDQLIQNHNIQNANELRRYIFTEIKKLNDQEFAKIFW